jgi:3D (Asp-Asp-Asp) domain-containing protein
MVDAGERRSAARGSRLSARVVVACALAASSIGACSRSDEPIRLPPVVVVADYRMAPAVVHGAVRTWWKNASAPARYGDPLPVGISMYCLQGTTRRGNYVRAGIAAADPRLFPLAQYIELYVGREYLGHFRIDDTGDRIRGDRIDVWTSDCRAARRFGIRRGTAVRVRGEPQVQLSGSAEPVRTTPR